MIKVKMKLLHLEEVSIKTPEVINKNEEVEIKALVTQVNDKVNDLIRLI